VRILAGRCSVAVRVCETSSHLTTFVRRSHSVCVRCCHPGPVKVKLTYERLVGFRHEVDVQFEGAPDVDVVEGTKARNGVLVVVQNILSAAHDVHNFECIQRFRNLLVLAYQSQGCRALHAIRPHVLSSNLISGSAPYVVLSSKVSSV
jgi:hypothetical protein